MYILFSLLVVLNALSQFPDATDVEEADPVVHDTTSAPHVSSLTFERLLSSFQWNLTHRTNYVRNQWFLVVDERFRSSLIRTDRTFIKDQQELRIRGGRRFNDQFDVRVSGSTLFLSDNQITGLNDAAISNAYIGIGFTPLPQLTVAPHIGYTTDRQAERTDRGISYLTQVYGRGLEFAEAFITLDGQYSLQRVDPRTVANHFIRVSIDRQFDAQTFVGVRSYYAYSRREFYFPADDATQDIFGVSMNIDQRFDRRVGSAVEIQYALRPNLVGFVVTSIDWRTVTRGYMYQPIMPITSYLFDSSVDEFSLNVRVGMRYSVGNWLQSISHITYSEQSEEHRIVSVDPAIPSSFVEERAAGEFRKNNISRRTTLATQGSIRLAQGHHVSFAGSSSILRYDTPSPMNFDDRDELRIMAFAGTHHELNRYLTLTLSVDLSVTHLVYLRAQRSANNNWNRVLRFSPTITYQPFEWFTTTNAFEVLANYTVYDFEDIVIDLRSLSFRQVGWIDSTRVSLSKNTRIDFFSHFRRYERGELRWRTFSERPIHSFEEITLTASLRYDVQPGAIAFAGGIRYFNRNRYRYVERTREFDTQLRNFGPTCYVYWAIDRRFTMVIQGWYELQFRDSEYYSTIPNVSIEIGARF